MSMCLRGSVCVRGAGCGVSADMHIKHAAAKHIKFIINKFSLASCRTVRLACVLPRLLHTLLSHPLSPLSLSL